MIRWSPSPRVMVIDDSDGQRRLLERVLNADGYACIAVDSGRDAFAQCVASAPDAVLLDVDLPEIDGLTICRALKGAPETRLTPVLIMTGHASADSRFAALEAGADDFLPKPVALRELRARLHSAVRMKHYVDDLDNAAASMVMLGAAIEARDRSTEGHCQRLSDYASALGKRIGLSGDDLRALELGGCLHDLGKIGIPDAILFKPGALSRSEFEIVKTHPLIGDRICSPLKSLDRVRPIIRSHHETLDGGGYPDGLRGAAVPLLAQIVAIVDVYDALTTDRPYRRALIPATALELLSEDCVKGKRDIALACEFAAIVEKGLRARTEGRVTCA